MQDPSVYLSNIGVTVASAMDSMRPAVLERALSYQIGYETFFFGDQDEKARFLNDITHYCGYITDPVTKQRFRPSTQSPLLMHDERPYYFVSDSTRVVFEMMPMMYASPHYEMLPKSDTL